MVAEAAQPPAKTTPPSRGGRRSSEIPIFTRLKARNLYLAQGLSHPQISKITGLEVRTVQRLAFREGWTKLRKRKKEQLEANADANAQAMQSEVLEAIASHSEQHALRSLDKVGEALERSDENAARDAQSYSGCLRNLVNVARDIRRPAENFAGEGARLNVFVLRVGDQAKPAQAASKATCEEINVTPSATENANANALSLNKPNTP